MPAGRKRDCDCDRWGCIRCMQRFIWQHYEAKRQEKRAIARGQRVLKARVDYSQTILDSLGRD